MIGPTKYRAKHIYKLTPVVKVARSSMGGSGTDASM